MEWGSELREHNGELQVKRKATNRWEPLSNYFRGSKQHIVERYFLDYGRWELPQTWVFNDFGHITCYFFKDLNRNGKLDGSERISGQMIHTTPADEALTATGHQNQIQLGVSHGCIHVKPADIDDMIRKLYLAKGNHIIVHPYYEAAPHEPIRVANPPYEVHFYPFSQKIYIRGESR